MDVAFLSATRSIIAVAAYACLSTRANLYRPYLYTSIGVAAAVAVFVAVKGALYDFSIEPSWMVRCPAWLAHRRAGGTTLNDRTGSPQAPVLFGLTLGSSLGHVMLGFHHSSMARRRRAHLEASRLPILSPLRLYLPPPSGAGPSPARSGNQ